MAKHNSKILSQESDTVVKPLPLVIVRSQRKVNAPYLVSVTKMELYTRLQLPQTMVETPRHMLAWLKCSNQDIVSIKEALKPPPLKTVQPFPPIS